MPDNDDAGHMSEPVDLSREVYAEGGDYELLCCTTIRGIRNLWVSAAEIVYELTGNAGSVRGNQITFEIDDKERIELDLLDGSFTVRRGKKKLHSGRKGLELLMSWKGMTFEEAMAWVGEKYSEGAAKAMALDYWKMRNA